jgi:hypothetical protein
MTQPCHSGGMLRTEANGAKGRNTSTMHIAARYTNSLDRTGGGDGQPDYSTQRESLAATPPPPPPLLSRTAGSCSWHFQTLTAVELKKISLQPEVHDVMAIDFQIILSGNRLICHRAPHLFRHIQFLNHVFFVSISTRAQKT